MKDKKTNWFLMMFSLFLLGQPTFSVSQELGRLFFSPLERKKLNQSKSRHLGNRSLNLEEAVPGPEDKIALKEPLKKRFDGFVQRKYNYDTIWINGKSENLWLKETSKSPRKEILLDDKLIKVKVGELIYPGEEGELQDLLPRGAIVIRKR